MIGQETLERIQRLAQFGELAADLAHDVSNPLMVISGNAQLCLMEDLQNVEVKKNLSVIIDESRRAKDILQELLMFSRPSTGERVEVDINRTLESLVKVVSSRCFNRDIAVTSDLAGDLPAVAGDQKRLQVAFLNLLKNAGEAIGEDGGTVTIITRAGPGGGVSVVISDSGRGMDEAVLGKACEPFFTTKNDGLGLGLPVCRGIVKEHGGQMTLESVPGKGTIVRISLPGAPEHKEETHG